MTASVPMSQQTTLHAYDADTLRRELASGSPEGGVTPRVPWRQGKYPGRGTHEDPHIVDWELGDAENPFNWSRARKWAITGQVRRLQLRLQVADLNLLIDAMLLSLTLTARYINVYGVLL